MRALLAAGALALVPASALAGNVANCELVVMEEIKDEDGGSMVMAAYPPAADFLQGVYDADTPLSTEHDGMPVRAVMCQRRDLMPDEDDYAILATGIPLALSQNFDSNTSDVLTVFFKGGAFQYTYGSADPIDPADEAALDALLADFSARDHGLTSVIPDEKAVATDGADE